MGLNKYRLQTEQTMGTANGEGGCHNFFDQTQGTSINRSFRQVPELSSGDGRSCVALLQRNPLVGFSLSLCCVKTVGTFLVPNPTQRPQPGKALDFITFQPRMNLSRKLLTS
jgi:hypothetical protein